MLVTEVVSSETMQGLSARPGLHIHSKFFSAEAEPAMVNPPATSTTITTRARLM
ncbi:MAG: hypothetical protein IPK93_11400 [Solirubrobacterales bacterium]|nr:hypothetical protein [Solirubrobacterales bacterium]